MRLADGIGVVGQSLLRCPLACDQSRGRIVATCYAGRSRALTGSPDHDEVSGNVYKMRRSIICDD